MPPILSLLELNFNCESLSILPACCATKGGSDRMLYQDKDLMIVSLPDLEGAAFHMADATDTIVYDLKQNVTAASLGSMQQERQLWGVGRPMQMLFDNSCWRFMHHVCEATLRGNHVHLTVGAEDDYFVIKGFPVTDVVGSVVAGMIVVCKYPAPLLEQLTSRVKDLDVVRRAGLRPSVEIKRAVNASPRHAPAVARAAKASATRLPRL
jgi:hypothetical protein